MKLFRSKHNFRTFALLVLTASLGQAAFAGMVMNLNVKDGDSISGEFQFRITVQSETLVTKVEFAVDDKYKGSGEATPYLFTVDTINEKEGPYKVTFTAYTTDGEILKKTLNLKIDNGVSKGLAFHLEAGKDALINSKWNVALNSGRVALKIDPKSTAAKLLLARAYNGKGVFDSAQKYAEDVILAEPNNRNALDLLSGINLIRAFRASGSGALSTISNAIKAAAKSRRAAIDASVDSLIKPTGPAVIAYADKMIAAGRYSLAIDALDPVFTADFKNSDAGNRLIYAQIRAARFNAANLTVANYTKFGSLDGYGFALKAVLLQYAGHTEESEAAEKEAFLSDPQNLGVKYAQAYLALTRNRQPVFRQISSQLDALDGASTADNFYQMISFFQVADYESARKRFEISLLAEPANYDLLVEKGNEAIQDSSQSTPDQKKRTYELASAYFRAALEAKPDAAEVLTALSISTALEGKADEALTFGAAAVQAGKEYAPAWYAYSCALGMKKSNKAATAAILTGAKLDKRLDGLPIPEPAAAWYHFAKYGRMPYFPPPGR